MDDITRVCRKCGQEKPLSEFVKNKTSALGRKHICKQCNTELVLKWRAANPEKIREYNRKYREKLSDGYLIGQLKHCNLPITPETIDYKRIQLKLYQEIKNQTDYERD